MASSSVIWQLKALVEEKLTTIDYQDTDLASALPHHAVEVVRDQTFLLARRDYLTWLILSQRPLTLDPDSPRLVTPYLVSPPTDNPFSSILTRLFWSDNPDFPALCQSISLLFQLNKPVHLHFAYVTFPALYNRFVSSEYLNRAQLFLTASRDVGTTPGWASMVMSFLLHAHRFLDYLRSSILRRIWEDGIPPASASLEVFTHLFVRALPRLTQPHHAVASLAFPAVGTLSKNVLAALKFEFLPALFAILRGFGGPFKSFASAVWGGLAGDPSKKDASDVAPLARAIAEGLRANRWVPAVEITRAIGRGTAPHFISEADAEIIRRIAANAESFRQNTAQGIEALPDSVFELGLRLFEVEAAIGADAIVVDQAGVPVVQIDAELHRQWAEIERRAEDQGVSPHKELPEENERLVEYGLRQMQRRLELMEKQRDAVRERLVGLALLDAEVKLVGKSVQALEVAVAQAVDLRIEGRVAVRLKRFQEQIQRIRRKTAVAAVVGSTGASAKFAAQIDRTIEKEQLREAGAIAGVATKLLREEAERAEATVPAFRIAESLEAFDGLACALGLAFIDAERPVGVDVPTLRQIEQPNDWEMAVSQEKRADYRRVLIEYKNSIVAKQGVGAAALPLPDLLQLIGEVIDARQPAEVKAYCLALVFETDEEKAAFARIVSKLQAAIEGEKIEVYDEIRRAVNEAYRLLIATQADD